MKFLVSEASCHMIHSRLSTILPFDDFARSDGSYSIRSLYFDDPLFSAYRDKEAGIRERKKFRIRYYNRDPSFIRLEEKEKECDYCVKNGVRISSETAELLSAGKAVTGSSDHALLEDFGRRVRTGSLFPVLFTDYVRTSFCHPLGRLRITLDCEIHASRFKRDIWDPGPAIPVMKEYYGVLEIKYTDVYPAHVLDLICDVPKTPSAVSKYCMGCEALL